MNLFNPVKKIFKPKLKLAEGTRFVSFLFIGFSILIAAGVLFAANMYYNIDTGEVVMEEVQRVTSTIRATASLIVGGTTTQNPATSTKLEVASGDVLLSAADQVLRFSGGTNYYIGLKATTTLSTTTTYVLPSTRAAAADYVLTWQAGDQLTWKSVSGAGSGDITAVGNVASGDAFTSDGTQGTSLWFYDAQGRGKLTIADLTATTTYTLPDLTGVVSLQQAATLTAGGVLFADSLGRIIQNGDFTYSTSTNMLQIGTGGIRILGAGAGYLQFQAPNMAISTEYTWPTSAGTNNYVLTTDGSGALSWTSVAGVGGISGSGTTNKIVKFTSNSTVGDSSIVDNYTGTALTIDAGGTTTIAYNLMVQGSGGITSALYTSTATATISSAAGKGIILDSGSGKIILASGDWIETYQGYEIGKSDTEILREMIPVFGFDLPVRCSTACETATTVSQTIEDYPFSPASAGTTRVHKFIIRYADSTTTDSSTWTVWNETTATTTATFQVPASASTDLGKGESYITGAVTIPVNTDDWSLRVQVPAAGVTIQIYQIFLAAYDKIL